jgi:hypothetical protein
MYQGWCRALSVLALLIAGDAFARTEVLKTRAGAVVHWTRAEITIGLDSSASSQRLDRLDVIQALQGATMSWNRIPASQPRFRFTTEPDRDVTVRFCRGTWQGDNIDLGSTNFEANPQDGSVSAASVEINECDHRFAPPGERVPASSDLQAVMTHELGHVLGLSHGDSSNAVMFPSGNGMATRSPTADDETALAIIYIGRELHPSSPITGDEPSIAFAPSAARPVLLMPASQQASPPSPPEASPKASLAKAPHDSVSVVNVKALDGREVAVYTCEPTLLPPITDSQHPPPPKRKSTAAGSKSRPGH